SLPPTLPSPLRSPLFPYTTLFRSRIPRALPDERFNELFAALASNRDRALVAFWISTGVRASELLGVRRCDVDPGQQLITVVRKRSEEHTSELQSRFDLVCRLLLEK